LFCGQVSKSQSLVV